MYDPQLYPEDIFEDFPTLMERFVLPWKRKHPDDIRIDGETSMGNWHVAGRFRHANKLWKLHADTHYEPPILAHEAMRNGSPDPFTQEPTPHGTALVLVNGVRRKMKSRYKYMYIYEML